MKKRFLIYMVIFVIICACTVTSAKWGEINVSATSKYVQERHSEPAIAFWVEGDEFVTFSESDVGNMSQDELVDYAIFCTVFDALVNDNIKMPLTEKSVKHGKIFARLYIDFVPRWKK